MSASIIVCMLCALVAQYVGGHVALDLDTKRVRRRERRATNVGDRRPLRAASPLVSLHVSATAVCEVTLEMLDTPRSKLRLPKKS